MTFIIRLGWTSIANPTVLNFRRWSILLEIVTVLLLKNKSWIYSWRNQWISWSTSISRFLLYALSNTYNITSLTTYSYRQLLFITLTGHAICKTRHGTFSDEICEFHNWNLLIKFPTLSNFDIIATLPRQQSSWGQHGAHLDPVGPNGPHVGPMNLAIWVVD